MARIAARGLVIRVGAGAAYHFGLFGDSHEIRGSRIFCYSNQVGAGIMRHWPRDHGKLRGIPQVSEEPAGPGSNVIVRELGTKVSRSVRLFGSKGAAGVEYRIFRAASVWGIMAGSSIHLTFRDDFSRAFGGDGAEDWGTNFVYESGSALPALGPIRNSDLPRGVRVSRSRRLRTSGT